MIKKSKPESWAPKRDSMPQPEKSGSNEWDVALKQGDVNLINPKKKDVKKESKNHILTNLEAILQESIATWKKYRRK